MGQITACRGCLGAVLRGIGKVQIGIFCISGATTEHLAENIAVADTSESQNTKGRSDNDDLTALIGSLFNLSPVQHAGLVSITEAAMNPGFIDITGEAIIVINIKRPYGFYQ